jgi:hypothetical protein
VALTNWLGAFGLALGVLAYTLAKLVPERRAWRDIGVLLLAATAAYGLAMPWIPPSTISTVEKNAQWIEGNFSQTGGSLLLWAPAALLVLLALKLALHRISGYLQFAIFYTLLTALPPLANAWGNVAIVPQPWRYHLEMELALALLVGLLLDAVLRRLPRRPGLAATSALILALLWPIHSDRNYARETLIKTADITATSASRIAQRLNQSWDGSRVLLTGSSSFWLAAFSDTPQLRGGFDQGVTLPVFPMATYEICSGDGAVSRQAEIAILWLKTLDVHGVVVSGRESAEVYKEFRHPDEFEGVLPSLWRDHGDVFYRVGPSTPLAHVVSTSDLVATAPVNGIDVAPLRRYVAALENPRSPRASFRWTSLHSASIQTDVPPNSAISVQISWSPGWHAWINGREAPILQDGLGFLYIVPPRDGPVTISIDYDGGAEMLAARWISGITIAMLGLACIWSWRNMRKPSSSLAQPTSCR